MLAIKLKVVALTKKEIKTGCVHPLTAVHFLETERVEKLVHRKL